MKSVEQERMKKAYNYVMRVKDSNIEGKYASLAKKLPAMIVQNGLVTTIAFLKAKAKEGNEHGILLSQLCEYMDEKLGRTGTGRTLITYLQDISLEEYLYISQEAIAFATWLKRIAEGELKDESSE